MDAVQLEDKCRLCLDSEGSRATTSLNDESFRKMLDSVCNLSFVISDQLPSKVCWQCSSKITEFHGFVQSIRCNQETLLTMLPLTMVKVETPALNNEIFLETEMLESTVKQEDFSPEEDKTDEVDVAPMSEDEPDSEPESSEKTVRISDDDLLIKQYFTLKCDSCSKSFDTYKQLSKHTRQAHKKKPSFQCCAKTFQARHVMLRHIYTHLKPFKCDICDKAFPYQQTLVQHMNIHMTDKEKPYKCTKCPRKYPKMHLLRTHARSHDRAECPTCKKTFANIYAMRTHTLAFHSDATRYVCDVCGKEFKTQRQVASHRLAHTQPTLEDGARCEICNVWISRKERLRRHITEIHESKETECDICHKTYPNLKAMRKHKSLVHVALNFECEVCGKRFKKALNLTEHRASAHTGEKLYSCEFCGMEMNSNGNLYAHKKNKHPVEWMEAKQKANRLTDG
ncbi:zinc finger protein 626-like [Aedes albopictus]|uniref:Transcription factor grauzone n=1 Tax=Aedes albopictus TaxID=7160 RepID=A0ABM1ZGQ2_AEDAL